MARSDYNYMIRQNLGIGVQIVYLVSGWKYNGPELRLRYDCFMTFPYL